MRVVEKLETSTEKHVKSVIDILERALDSAKKGEIHAVAICVAGPNPHGEASRVGYLSSESSRFGPQLLAAVTATHWRLCQNMWDTETNDLETEYFPDPA